MLATSASASFTLDVSDIDEVQTVLSSLVSLALSEAGLTSDQLIVSSHNFVITEVWRLIGIAVDSLGEIEFEYATVKGVPIDYVSAALSGSGGRRRGLLQTSEVEFTITLPEGEEELAKEVANAEESALEAEALAEVLGGSSEVVSAPSLEVEALFVVLSDVEIELGEALETAAIEQSLDGFMVEITHEVSSFPPPPPPPARSCRENVLREECEAEVFVCAWNEESEQCDVLDNPRPPSHPPPPPSPSLPPSSPPLPSPPPLAAIYKVTFTVRLIASQMATDALRVELEALIAAATGLPPRGDTESDLAESAAVLTLLDSATSNSILAAAEVLFHARAPAEAFLTRLQDADEVAAMFADADFIAAWGEVRGPAPCCELRRHLGVKSNALTLSLVPHVGYCGRCLACDHPRRHATGTVTAVAAPSGERQWAERGRSGCHRRRRLGWCARRRAGPAALAARAQDEV